MNKVFTTALAKAIFESHEVEDVKNLLVDAGLKKIKTYTKEQSEKRIKDLFFEALGLDENANAKEIRKAVRRHKIDVYEVIEEIVPQLIVTGFGESPFFDRFVEYKSSDLGDANEFYTPDDVILTVSEVSGNHHDLVRQRLGEGKTYAVKTSWYGVKF